MKNKKTDIIKNCLKKGVPVAALSVVVMAACSGCDDNDAPQRTSGIIMRRSSAEKTVEHINNTASVRSVPDANKIGTDV